MKIKTKSQKLEVRSKKLKVKKEQGAKNKGNGQYPILKKNPYF
jgi:hypothetical protein